MGADTRLAYIRYTRARVRRLAVVAVAAVVARWPITTHDTFISIRARNAQYSTALPYVKSRQIAENLLVLPN